MAHRDSSVQSKTFCRELHASFRVDALKSWASAELATA